MTASLKPRHIIAGVLLLALVVGAGWILWNRPTRVDMAAYAPADCLAFVESNDLPRLAEHISATEAWKALAGLIGAKPDLIPSRWGIRLARWTGIGSAASVVFARSQVALVFCDAQTTQSGDVLTVKPVTALIIETHTSASRSRPVMENAIAEFANRIVGPTIREQRKQADVDIVQWSSQDHQRRLSAAFVGTAVIVSNDELLLARCVNIRRGTVPSLASDPQLIALRQRVNADAASVSGFISKTGVKPIVQAWTLSQAGASENSLTVARLFGDTFGNLIDGFAWSSALTDGRTEDHCFIALSAGVANQLRANLAPNIAGRNKLLTFVPNDAYSVSIYNVRETEGFWRDLNATVSFHAEALAAIASRPFLRSLLKPYGIEDADAFVRAIGPEFATVRLDSTSQSVLIAEALDRPGLRKIVQHRLGPAAKTESIGDAELMLSNADGWGAAFAGDYFFTGPGLSVRHCLQSAQGQSITSIDQFRRAQALIDVSLPFNLTRFTDDRQSAISFVELFSQTDRPAFSANADLVDKSSRTLSYAVSVAMLKDDGFDWTSRSSFGLLGSLSVYLAPQRVR